MVAEANGDVVMFLKELDEKRKQLDEQIHKFIAQKEREFQRYEQEMRKKYLISQANDSSQAGPVVALNPTVAQAVPDHVSEPPRLSTQSSAIVEDNHESVRSKIDRKSANSGLEDIRPSYEREKDFMGLFTPSFLPLLDGKPELNRSPSAPVLTDASQADLLPPDRQQLQRANTEPLLNASGNVRPGSGQRTPSSGSEGLVSALKSSAERKTPKPMRVRIKLGDDQPTVRPADDVSAEEEHAPVRQAEAMHHSRKQDDPDRFKPVQEPKLQQVPVDVFPNNRNLSSLTQGLASRPSDPLMIATTDRRPLDKVDDLGDLASPFPLDEEVSEAQAPESDDWEVDFQEDIGKVPQSESLDHSMNSLDDTMSPVRSPPKPDILGGFGTPILKIRSSSSSSGQPILPGFSRPTVRDDPKFDLALEEIENTQDSTQSSSFYDSFARPSLSKNTMTGSLGESYMQRNAEEMMRRKRS